jgi:hypothetical protein
MLLDWTVISQKVVNSIEERQKGADATNLSFYPRKTVFEISETMVKKYTVSILCLTEKVNWISESNLRS